MNKHAVEQSDDKLDALSEVLQEQYALSAIDVKALIHYQLYKNSRSLRNISLGRLLGYLNYSCTVRAGVSAMRAGDKIAWACTPYTYVKRMFADGQQEPAAGLDNVGCITICSLFDPFNYISNYTVAVSTRLPNPDSAEQSSLKDFCGVAGDCTLIENGCAVFSLSQGTLLELIREKLRAKIPKFDEAMRCIEEEIKSDTESYLKLLVEKHNGTQEPAGYS